MGMSDTIAAIATGAGRSAIGIVRLSGPESRRAVEALFTPFSGKKLSDYPPGMLVYGALRDQEGKLLDQCLATWSAAPRSYTGEDTAELQCHGSPAVLTAALEALFALGVRQARAGEFTPPRLPQRTDGPDPGRGGHRPDRRRDPRCRPVRRQPAGGAMSRKIGGIYDTLVDLVAHFDVVLDYSDEDLEPFDQEEITAAVGRAAGELEALEASYRRGGGSTTGWAAPS